MYSFSPLASIPVSHDGMFVMSMLVIGILVCVWISEGIEYFVLSLIPAALVLLLTYCVSYVWTDQTPKVFPNQQVTGEFVEFVAEGYNIPVQSGKTTRHVDQHEQYVVYKVNGQRVMLRSNLGSTYPERVTLYKN